MGFNSLVEQIIAPNMSKTGREAAMRELMVSHKIGEKWPKKDILKANFLCRTRYVDIQKYQNPSYPNAPNHLRGSYDGKVWEQFSWIKRTHDVVRGSMKSKRSHVMHALRHAIKDTMRNFVLRSNGVCEKCGERDNLTCDHKDPPFSSIAKQYLKKYGAPALKENVGTQDIIRDKRVLNQWLRFHDKLAVLQVLCKSCNSKKGNRS